MNTLDLKSNHMAILRAWVGVIFLYSGLILFDQKALLQFAEWLKGLGIPYPLLSAYLSKSTELFGGLLLCVGLFTRIITLIHIFNMAVATFVALKGDILGKATLPFLLLIILIISILPGHPQNWSIDNWLRSKKNNRSSRVIH